MTQERLTPEQTIDALRRTPDPKIATKTPRGRSIEEVARIIADVEEHGAADAARRHRMSASGVSALARKWRRHPVVIETVEARRPQIEARIQAALRRYGAELDAKLRRIMARASR